MHACSDVTPGLPVDGTADKAIPHDRKRPDLVTVAQHLLVAGPVVRVPNLTNKNKRRRDLLMRPNRCPFNPLGLSQKILHEVY